MKYSRGNDLYSIYAYGNDAIKIVYYRNIKNRAKFEPYPLFDELADIPARYRGMAAKAIVAGELQFPELPKPAQRAEKNKNAHNAGERFKQSVSRARARVFELAMCNEFTHFCTFTQSGEMRDRFDLKAFRKDFSQFVRDENKKHPGRPIKYLLIPEQHMHSRKAADVGAWHMYGLLSGLTYDDLRLFTLREKLPQNIRKVLKNGEKVYNWERYSKKFGFFTCSEIVSQEGCAKYITKYITKDLNTQQRAAGEHLFFASQGLKGRETVLKNEANCPFTEWDFENEYVKIKWLSLSEIQDSKI